MSKQKLKTDVHVALAGAPDEAELLRLAEKLVTAYADADGDHQTRHLEIRELLKIAHQRLCSCPCAGVLETPLGWLGLIWSERGLQRLVLPRPSRAEVLDALQETAPAAEIVEPPEELSAPLQRYFAGQPIDPLPPLDLAGLPPFRQRVLDLACSIPYGETRTYRWIAEMVGTRAYQAVGQALGANPIPIIIPCHRVVASDGSLRGYAGGVDLKRRLLEFERRDTVQPYQP